MSALNREGGQAPRFYFEENQLLDRSPPVRWVSFPFPNRLVISKVTMQRIQTVLNVKAKHPRVPCGWPVSPLGRSPNWVGLESLKGESLDFFRKCVVTAVCRGEGWLPGEWRPSLFILPPCPWPGLLLEQIPICQWGMCAFAVVIGCFPFPLSCTVL